jgi:micrococcal nuclease
MYRPAAEGSPSQATAPRQQAGATMPAESGTSEPATAVAEQPSTDQSAAEEAVERTIKGNVRPDGEKIYHLPNDPSYARTNAEQWFASVEEAEAAGYRRAGRPRES